MAKPRKENIAKAKAIMAAMLGMKPKPHDDMKLKPAKRRAKPMERANKKPVK